MAFRLVLYREWINTLDVPAVYGEVGFHTIRAHRPYDPPPESRVHQQNHATLGIKARIYSSPNLRSGVTSGRWRRFERVLLAP